MKVWQSAHPRHQQGTLLALLRHGGSFEPMASQCDALGLDDLSDSAKAATDAAVAAAALLRALAKVGDVMGILHDDEEELRAELAAANSTIWALTDHHNQTDQTLIRERAELAAAKAERDAALARAEVAEALLRKARMFVECFATPADGNFDSISTFKVEIPADGYQRQWAVHAAPAVMVDINAAIGGDHV